MITLEAAYSMANAARAQIYRAFAYLFASMGAIFCAAVVAPSVNGFSPATAGLFVLLFVALIALRASERCWQKAITIYRRLDRELQHGED